MTFSKSDRAEARESLAGQIKPGDTISTILRHVSRSGMSRSISVMIPSADHPGEIQNLSFRAAAAIAATMDRDRDAVKVSGCGMDMGFHVVYALSSALYPDGFGCIGTGCPSNDHSNGDRERAKHNKARPHWHRDGGYALRHRWI